MEQAHRELLRSNHSRLGKIISANVREVLDYLQEHRIISNSMRERVSLITKTQTEQGGDLLYLLPTRGRHAFQAFYDAVLQSDLFDAADILRPESAPHGPSYDPVSTSSSSSHNSSAVTLGEDISDDEVLPDHWPLSEEESKQMVIVKTHLDSKSPGRWQRLYDQACTPGQEDCYQVLHKKRGLCLIINNEHFERLEDRTGTENDVTGLRRLFEGLGFDIYQKLNRTSQQMESLLMDKVKTKDHTHSDCFVLVVLTHGDAGVVFGVDGYTDESGTPQNYLRVEWLRDLVCSVPSLLYKPKLIFLQACRGKGKDIGMTKEKVKKDKMDSLGSSGDAKDGGSLSPTFTAGEGNVVPGQSEQNGNNGGGVSQQPSSASNEGSLFSDSNIDLRNTSRTKSDAPEDCTDASGERVSSRVDAFMAMSTTDGYLSWRNTKSGTWFIQAVVYVFSRFAYKYDINTLMTKVTRLVSQGEVERSGYKQVCEWTPTLPKQFYFFPKLSKID